MYKVLKNVIVLGRSLKAGETVSDLNKEETKILLAMGRIEKADAPVEEPKEAEEVKAETNRSVKPKRTRKAK